MRYDELLVTEREMIYRLSKITGYGPDIVKDVIKAEVEFIFDELKNGIPVRLGRVGQFEVRRANVYAGYNFHTKQNQGMKEMNFVKFKVSKPLKMAIREAEI